MLVYPLPMQPGFFSYVARSFGHHVNNQSPGAGAFVEENYLVMKDECQKNDDRNRHADKPEKNTATPSRLHLHMKQMRQGNSGSIIGWLGVCDVVCSEGQTHKLCPKKTMEMITNAPMTPIKPNAKK